MVEIARAAFTSMLMTLATQSLAIDAEYAVRWSPSDGGPSTTEQVFATLQVQAGKPKVFEVRYYAVTRPADAPEGFQQVLRQRLRSDGKSDVTWKYRGGSTFPSGSPAAWTCPLSHEGKRKDEVDISVLTDGAVKRSLSRSCTTEAAFKEAVGPALQAKAIGCASKMVRRESQDKRLTVEQWKLADGGLVLEVSMKGEDTASVLSLFQSQVVDTLLAADAKPLDRSKTEIGTKCTANLMNNKN